MCWGARCWCADVGQDRLSASLINKRVPKTVDGQIPLYQEVDVNAAAGFIMNPYLTDVLCSYPGDGGSAQRLCDPPGVSETCVPGCYQAVRDGGGPSWCSANDIGGGTCAYRPTDTKSMLDAQRVSPMSGTPAGYNEIIIDRASWTRMQPNSIEGVWFLSFPDCDREDTSMMCESTARRVRDQFIDDFHLDPHTFPLLKLDPWNWDKPFSEVMT